MRQIGTPRQAQDKLAAFTALPSVETDKRTSTSTTRSCWTADHVDTPAQLTRIPNGVVGRYQWRHNHLFRWNLRPPGKAPDYRQIDEPIWENIVKEVPHNKHVMKEGPKSERGTDEHREKPLPVTPLFVARYHAPHRSTAELLPLTQE